MRMFLVSFSRSVLAPQERGHQNSVPALYQQGGAAMDGRSSFLARPCPNDPRPKMVEKYGNPLQSQGLTYGTLCYFGRQSYAESRPVQGGKRGQILSGRRGSLPALCIASVVSAVRLPLGLSGT